MIKIIQDSAKVIILSMVVLFSVHLAGAVWSEPTVAPTGGNISAPLDVSSTGQTKVGGLILNTGGSTNGLVVSAGKVGIGVASPAAPLEVYGGSGASSQSTGDIFRLSSSGLARLLFGFDPITPFGSWIQSNSSYPILLNPVAGNVGIGTSSPSQKLSVAGTIYSSTGGFKFPDGTIQTTAAGGSALEAFGGLYTKRDTACTNANPLTGACSCASGFTDTTFLTFSVNASFSCGWYEGYTTTGPCGQSSIETHECWNPNAIASACTPGNQTFSYTGAQQTLVIGSGCTTITVDAIGASGSDAFWGKFGGKGGRSQGNITVTPGETLYIYVGGRGLKNGDAGAPGGYNGGGVGGGWSTGGGASDVRRGGTALTDRVIVAGGGGAAGSQVNGGDAGGTTGNSALFEGYGATGGTQSAGGSGSGGGTSGSLGQGGTWGSSQNAFGGGGGYYGGGAVANDGASPPAGYGGGGGGSSLVPGGGSTTSGYGSLNSHGSVYISW